MKLYPQIIKKKLRYTIMEYCYLLLILSRKNFTFRNKQQTLVSTHLFGRTYFTENSIHDYLCHFPRGQR